MKTTTLALAGILLASAASAGDLACVLKDKRGNHLFYEFELIDRNTVAEVAMTRNGTTVSSEPGRRPIWQVVKEGDYMILLSLRDPGYGIIFADDLERVGSVYRSDASLRQMRNGEPVEIARGGCGVVDGRGA